WRGSRRYVRYRTLPGSVAGIPRRRAGCRARRLASRIRFSSPRPHCLPGDVLPPSTQLDPACQCRGIERAEVEWQCKRLPEPVQRKKHVQHCSRVEEELCRQDELVKRRVEYEQVRSKDEEEQKRDRPAQNLMRPQLKSRPARFPWFEQDWHAE